MDDIDKIVEEVKNKKPYDDNKYRDSDLVSIAQETRKWWSGIKDGSIQFIKSIELLREYVPAYIPGHVIIISGYTSAGKSQLLAQIILDSGTEGANVLVISVEDSRMEKMISMISVFTGTVHRKKMILGTVDDDNNEIDRAIDFITTLPIKIYDDVYTLIEIESLINKHSPSIVVVDYVQNLNVPGGGVYEQMSSAAKKLFQLAQTYKITMIVASQVSNDSVQNESEVISLKGAGELAAVAHTVIQLKKGRQDENRHKVKIQIKKNKAFGNCGEIDARFNDEWTIIEKENYGSARDRFAD